jgi:HEAT repeat protein
MCAKVVAQHEVGEAADALLDLLDDEVPRVRAAAARALGAVGEHEHLAALESATQDPEPAVVDAVERAVGMLRRRIDAV